MKRWLGEKSKKLKNKFWTDSEYLEAFEVWEWYAFCKVTKACTLSLLIDALDDSPKGSFPESLAVQRIAVQFGFAGKEDLN